MLESAVALARSPRPKLWGRVGCVFFKYRNVLTLALALVHKDFNVNRPRGSVGPRFFVHCYHTMGMARYAQKYNLKTEHHKYGPSDQLIQKTSP
jgi:hypothetical protein